MKDTQGLLSILDRIRNDLNIGCLRTVLVIGFDVIDDTLAGVKVESVVPSQFAL